MKISTNIIVVAALLACYSCSEPKKDNVVTITPGAPLFPSLPAATQAGQPGAAANVNPPHGQPGHNCAVPVGAPLNAAPAPALNAGAPAAPAAGPTVAAAGPLAAPGTQTTATPAPAAVAPGTNPPHGQPGHDCSVAIGAPLKKKPASALQATPALTTSAPAAVAPGTNPPHGLPGHDCSVAVGAPLKTK
jgi:hypothetical protein